MRSFKIEARSHESNPNSLYKCMMIGSFWCRGPIITVFFKTEVNDVDSRKNDPKCVICCWKNHSCEGSLMLHGLSTCTKSPFVVRKSLGPRDISPVEVLIKYTGPDVTEVNGSLKLVSIWPKLPRVLWTTWYSVWPQGRCCWAKVQLLGTGYGSFERTSSEK